MPPLLVPVLIVSTLSIALLALALRVAKRSRRWAIAVAACSAAGLLVNALFLLDDLLLAQLLPVADVMIYGNLILPLTALLAGASARLLPGPTWQRTVLIAALIGAGIWRFAGPLAQPPPPLHEARWTNGVCRQSSLASCSAAAAATVLADAGIPADEREMVEHCVTTVDGTTNLGVYRGLVRGTRGTPWRVEVVRGSAAEVAAMGLSRCVFSIGLPGQSAVLPGNRHSVVLFGFGPDGTADVGDPFAGRQPWAPAQFERLWPGVGVRLVPVR